VCLLQLKQQVIKRDLKRIHGYVCRCNERIKAKTGDYCLFYRINRRLEGEKVEGVGFMKDDLCLFFLIFHSLLLFPRTSPCWEDLSLHKNEHNKQQRTSDSMDLQVNHSVKKKNTSEYKTTRNRW
jgi:hypothetical protein